MSDSILLTVTDGLAHMTLNRPERLNVIDSEARTIGSAFDSAEARSRVAAFVGR